VSRPGRLQPRRGISVVDPLSIGRRAVAGKASGRGANPPPMRDPDTVRIACSTPALARAAIPERPGAAAVSKARRCGIVSVVA
jgi:hypothetical protein